MTFLGWNYWPTLLRNTYPHAGYVFSGAVAATAIAQLTRPYQRVFLLGASHQEAFSGASVYCSGDFDMPYGTVPVDKVVGQALVQQHPRLFKDHPTLQAREHSLEVLLPFLHRKLGDQTPIVPILIGDVAPDGCERLAEALEPWFTSDNLFLISSDFSHYPEGEAAKRLDAETMEAICSNQPARLERTLGTRTHPPVRGLVTRLCGWRAVLTLMHLTKPKSLTYHPLVYAHSGDNPLYGESNQVVGYWAIAVTEQSQPNGTTAKQAMETPASAIRTNEATPSVTPAFTLTDAEKESLLSYARQVLKAAVKGKPLPDPNPTTLSDTLKAAVGAFVTLHKHGHLRGCIGQMTAWRPLYQTTADMTVAAALHDGRFRPVSPEELGSIDIELSILSPLERIDSVDELVLGRDGILIEKGAKRGVFLPQVATETGWNLEQFLGHCARDKAGLGWDGWKQARIYRFTATIFGEKGQQG